VLGLRARRRPGRPVRRRRPVGLPVCPPPREHFDRLVGDIKAGKLDAIWVWELSRLQRDLSVFAPLRDLCRTHRVLWINRDRVQDPADYRDMTMTAI
jgi:DNA invertase Pin-like site-specific DNA recombinase